jgi:hypothetical protein
MTTSVYTLKDMNDKYPRLSVCQMDKVNGYEDEDLELFIGYLEPRSLPGGVIFAAQRVSSSNSEYVTGDMTYTVTITNIGNGFDKTTGIFMAPVAGTYQFNYSSQGNFAAAVHVFVKKNGSIQFETYEGGADNDAGILGMTFQISLVKGEQINMYVDGQVYIENDMPAFFSGFLISE